ncbi:MAG: NAD(P)/FAD-dependent oxidoreductase [Dehalococcoidia bacterium]
MYDAIVVGARVAGAPTAMLLARAGYRVVVVDRDTFPSDIMSTHYIHQPGVAKLQDWGLLDRILATGAPPITKLTTVRHGVSLSGMSHHPQVGFALCPRRFALDQALVDAAVASGVEFRDGFVVDDVLWESDTVVGIRGHRKGGEPVEERARVVVGADGVHSVVARAVSPTEYNTRPALGCGYYSYYSGVAMDGAEIYFLDDCIVFGFPTNDGQTCVAVEYPNSALGRCARTMRPPSSVRSAACPILAHVWRRDGVRPVSPAWARSRTSSASRTVPAGRWSATPAITRTRSPAWASPTPSSMPTCWRGRSMPASPAGCRWRRRWRSTSSSGTRGPSRSTR